MKRYWLLIFVLILALRLFFSTLSFNPDINNNLNWVDSIRSEEMMGFYERDFAPYSQANYPPLITMSFYYFDKLAELISPQYSSVRPTFNKLPTIIVESAMLILVLIELPLVVFFLLLFNPGIFYNSVLWGQTEGLVASLVLFSFYFIFRRKPLIASLLIVASVLTKQSAIIFIPLFIFALYKETKMKTTIWLTALSLAIYSIFFIPFYGNRFFAKSITFILDSSQGQSHFASVNALNFWYALGYNKVSDGIGVVSLQAIGAFFFLILLVLIIHSLRKKLDFQNSLIAAGLINYAACMFLTRIHERHFLPSLILLVPLVLRKKVNIALYTIISIIYFLNLYLIWHEKFASFDQTILRLLSSVMVASFFYFLSKFLDTKKTP